MEIKFKELLESAKSACKNSYSPYSFFPVGACVLFDNGNTYCGTNIENSSYGLTLCAERSAIASAISAGEKGKIVAIAIYSCARKLCYPCGACRQWISEFAQNDDIKIILEDKGGCDNKGGKCDQCGDEECGEPKIFTLNELLPHTFML